MRGKKLAFGQGLVQECSAPRALSYTSYFFHHAAL